MRLDLFYIGFISFVSIISFTACQKVVPVDLPAPQQKICVEGKIEPGIPPYVILTHNMPYFGPTDVNAIQNMFVHDAIIVLSDGTNADTLHEYCTQSLPDSLLPLIALFTGVHSFYLKSINYCIYTTFNTALWGSVGKTYNLSIDAEGRHLTSVTSILPPIPLDSTWAKYLKVSPYGDSLGFVYAHLTDPPAEGNSYRWLSMRKGKDFSFLSPSGSAFNDKFINGQSFDFAYYNPGLPGTGSNAQNDAELGYFKKGDTVIVKFCSIDHSAFEFYRQMDVALQGQGNPFAAPTSVQSNIYPRQDALGVWCGYGVYIDTVVFK